MADFLEFGYCKIEFLTGEHFPCPCPICHNPISHRTMPDAGECHWYCKGCGTEWPVGGLIDALNYREDKEIINA